MNRPGARISDIELLAGIGASVRLSPAFRLGTADPDIADHLIDKRGLRAHQLDPVRVLLEETLNRFKKEDAPASDAWIGPRLHAALRLSRREAGNRNVWRFLGLWGADYVRWRFGPPLDELDPEKAPKPERFVGPDSKQAFSRLWWMAEVFRDGKNYKPAALALTNQDIVNNFFRMRISNHRPTAQAFLRVLPSDKAGESLPDGRAANALAKATNAAASTLMLDIIGLDNDIDIAARSQWENVRSDYDPRLYFDKMPEGPDDGSTPPEAINQMKELLTQLLAEANIRGRS